MAFNLGYDSDFSEDIGLGKEDESRVRSNQIDWYKAANKGQTDRVALAYFHPLEFSALRLAAKENPKLTEADQKEIIARVRKEQSEKIGKPLDQLDMIDMLDTSEARFKAVDASFKEGLGYVQWPKTLTEAEKTVWSQLPEKRTYVLTVLVIYPTDRDGDLDRERLTTSWKVMPWRFSPDKYDKLRKLNKGMQESGGIAASDLLFTCKEPQYQNIDITPAGQSMWQRNPKFKRLVLERAVQFYPKLNPFKPMKTDELREKLGLGGSGGGVSSGGLGEDFESILNNIS
jgi:hypothetical protein